MPGWSSTTLSTLRLRGALGRSGLQPNAFAKLTTFGPFPAETGPGLSPRNLGNADLKPEVTREIEAGAEIGLFNNRLGFDVTRWDRHTTDALVAKQFAPTGGFYRSQLANIGELSAKGWEIKVNAAVIDRPNFSLNLFGNAAYLFQKVVSLGGAAPLKVGGSYPRYRNYIVEGQAPGVLLGAALLPTTGDQVPFDTDGDGNPDTMAQLVAYLATVPTCGSNTGLDCFTNPNGIGPLMVRKNGLLAYDNCLGPVRADGYCEAKSTPDWAGSFGANVTLARSWQINTLFEYKVGNYYVTNLTDAFRKANPTIGRNVKYSADLESTILNPASTGQERADALMKYVTTQLALSPYDGLNQSENGSFVRLREVGITYSAPASFAQRLGLRNVAFNLSGRDLALFTPYTGIDPELNQFSRGSTGTATDQNFGDGIDAWGFPLPRQFTFSVRFGF
jgi:hypothetical protein